MSILRRMAAGAIVARSNTSPFERPDRLPRAMLAMAPWGASLPGAVAAAAARYPDRVAIVDDGGSVSYGELWARARSVAAGLADLADLGAAPGATVGVLGRNHRGFVEWLVGAAATGAHVVLMNTGFAGPQLADVVEHEDVSLLLHDDEFTDVAAASDVPTVDETTAAAMASAGRSVRPTRHQGRLVILTSGTTGRPKGAARRSDAGAIEGAAAVLERIPLRLGDTQVVAAPLFHAWGLVHLTFGFARCATTILARRFDPGAILQATSEHDADVLAVVPVMLSRILALAPDELVAAPTPRLRVIASSGSALGGPLATAVLDRFGPVLYNLYGSTEVAVATIATPDDLRRAPSTAGRAAFGVRVEILDDAGNPVAPGTTGRIFVGGSMRFDGYTTGGGKEIQRGLLSTGDVGHLDERGLLFVEGRDDDMIVSGGENVFPAEVEELLAGHPGIADVAVVGVPDDEFGQALRAHVVIADGAELSVDDVRRHVREHLARHKVPRQVTFCAEVPRNATGKILRRSLADSHGAERSS